MSQLVLEIAHLVEQLLAQRQKIFGGQSLLLGRGHGAVGQRNVVDGRLDLFNDGCMLIRFRLLFSAQLGLELFEQLALVILDGLGLGRPLAALKGLLLLRDAENTTKKQNKKNIADDKKQATPTRYTYIGLVSAHAAHCGGS